MTPQRSDTGASKMPYAAAKRSCFRARSRRTSQPSLSTSQKFPHKTILRIDGTVQGPSRAQAMLEARTQVFDVLGYTASVDSGVSIDILGYDLVICRVDVRSVHSITLCQMMQRVRHLLDNKIVVLCEARAKD